MPKKILFSFGTRPEAIKLAPVIKEMIKREIFDVRVCVTAQHREMVDQVLELFEIYPDYDLNIMVQGQTLEYVTSAVIKGVGRIVADIKPDCMVVQGDTTTTFASALAAFYHKVPVAHVEAGLRTHQRYAPFPEEINRCLTSAITTWHFSPTERARKELLCEGFPDKSIFVIGNSVIDALLATVPKAIAADHIIREELRGITWNDPYILVTGHRRESFGDGFRHICKALRTIAETNRNIAIVYPVHLNPNVQRPVSEIIADHPNIYLLEPVNYLTFVWLLNNCRLVLTDSGGIQEEAPSLGKPTLVMRDVTERPEAVEAGVAILVGTDVGKIVGETQRLLIDREAYQSMSRVQNPYGDGTSSIKISDILQRELEKERH